MAEEEFWCCWPVHCAAPDRCGKTGQLTKKLTCGEAMIFLGNHLRCARGHQDQHTSEEIRDMVAGYDWKEKMHKGESGTDMYEEIEDHVTSGESIADGLTQYDEFEAEKATRWATRSRSPPTRLQPRPPARPPRVESRQAPIGAPHRERELHAKCRPTPPPPRGPPPPLPASAADIGQQIAGAIAQSLQPILAVKEAGAMALPASSSSAVVAGMEPVVTLTGMDPALALRAATDHRRILMDAATTIGDAAQAAREMANIANKAAKACDFEGAKLDMLQRQLLGMLPRSG